MTKCDQKIFSGGSEINYCVKFTTPLKAFHARDRQSYKTFWRHIVL